MVDVYNALAWSEIIEKSRYFAVSIMTTLGRSLLSVRKSDRSRFQATEVAQNDDFCVTIPSDVILICEEAPSRA